jgi:hypothetical protein
MIRLIIRKITKNIIEKFTESSNTNSILYNITSI